MAAEQKRPARVRVDGKFFRLGAEKFFVKGVTYGPFAPNADGEMFGSPERARSDFALLGELGANVVRVYYVPPRWFLDLAEAAGLKVLVDIPWGKHLCFLDSAAARDEARQTVRDAVKACGGHPAVFACSVVNEIPAEIVRWSGVKRVQRFLEELVEEARSIEPECLYACASFPSTEFLQCANADFVCFNVYLHDPKAFQGYLARLQTIADARPLVLGELGMDAIRNGEKEQGEFLGWQLELAFRSGLAGAVVFSFTDEWFRGGMTIQDWSFGLTTQERAPKPAFQMVRDQYRAAPYFPLPRSPKVSVVVATYNGARTLRQCLESLMRLNYPDYEVILVDDGSTDNTAEIGRAFPSARYLAQSNQGLSAARNAGIRAARGEIVAFTDDDCRADEDWLYYLVQDLVRGDWAGIGGHNFLPPEDSSVAAVVMASPGGPAQVLLTDQEAEHIPGCNMAFYKWALEGVGMFDPLFRKAGDDVDLCWRLLDSNLKIGFSPAGFVWHYRRSTLKAYMRQQAGYGEAEALLIGKHPEHYNALGGGIWHGRIYSSALPGLLLRRGVIYHGIFGSAFFQKMYAPNLGPPVMLFTSLAYQALVNLPLLALAINFGAFVPLAAASLSITLGTCAIAALQAAIPRQKKRVWSRPLVAMMFLIQPLVRDWARVRARISRENRKSAAVAVSAGRRESPRLLHYWSARGLDRHVFLGEIVARLAAIGWFFRIDTGWVPYDLEIAPGIWSRLRLTTVSEDLAQGRRCLRCRLQPRWSVPARVVFGVALAAVLSLLGWRRQELPWLWYGLLLLPGLWWMFDEEGEVCAGEFAVVVDEVAAGHALIRVDSEAAETGRGAG